MQYNGSLQSYCSFELHVSLSAFKTAVMMHVDLDIPIPLKTSGLFFDMQLEPV